MIQQIGPTLVNLRQWLAAQSSLPKISLWTLKRILRQAGFRWKRVRKSLKDQQDPILMAFFRQELQALNQAHQQGELTLWFYDETGIGLNPSGLYAWQQAGSVAHLPARRGQGFTLAGFLSADNALTAFSYSGPTTSQAFIALVDEWLNQSRPRVKPC